MTANSVSIGILGATGYTGVELLRLVQDHPSVHVACMTSERHAGQPIAAVFPHLAGRTLPTLAKVSDIDAGALDVVFGCLPHGTTQEVVRDLPRGPRVVDISADFRYSTAAAYEAVYKHHHGAPHRIGQFTCAVPEHLKKVTTPHVGHPGCFSTAILLASVPLLASGPSDHVQSSSTRCSASVTSKKGVWARVPSSRRTRAIRLNCPPIRRSTSVTRRSCGFSSSAMNTRTRKLPSLSPGSKPFGSK